MEKIEVSDGIFWINIPDADIKILCGCPADAVKHLMKKGLISNEEKSGIVCETGPNAILLSEVFLQNGHFANLAEFPIMQMLYRQGLILPGHPNNTGRKPLLLGHEEAIRTQTEYIFRGTYGLIAEEELLETGISEQMAKEIMRFKLRFAFDNIRCIEELIDAIAINDEAVEIAQDVTLQRIGFNQYQFAHQGNSIQVDLNLGIGQEYQPPYKLSHHQISKEYFSVIHSGEGNGWDMDRPCMASIITFQGKIYLVDAGPNLLHSLRVLGIGISEIDGIFHTHAHDDHFAGLTALLSSDHKIKYYAAPIVRASTIKKFCALMAIPEEQFQRFFNIQDLRLDVWNNIDGLEVRPSISPHPVETTILFFRTLWGNGYQSYAHLADIIAFDVCEQMLEENQKKSGITRQYYQEIQQQYLTPCSLKKVDIGGGMIHGKAQDFNNDRSEKILFSHIAEPLTNAQREIGSNASFGTTDTLIPATQDYSKQKAFHHLQNYFPSAPKYELQMFLNCPTVHFNPGSIIFKKNHCNDHLYLVLSGIVEVISSELHIQNKLNVGSFIGGYAETNNNDAPRTCRAISHTKALAIPQALYLEFLKRNGIYDEAKENQEKHAFLQKTWLFGEQVSCPQKNSILPQMQHLSVTVGWQPAQDNSFDLFMLKQGGVILQNVYGNKVEELKPGDFFGEEKILQLCTNVVALATENSELWRIPEAAFLDIPIVQWKLIETMERRNKLLNTLS